MSSTSSDSAPGAAATGTADVAGHPAVLRVRDSLLAEHLGVGRDEIQAALRAADGSLVRAMDRLARPSGPTLVPFDPPELSEAERELAETHVLDPHRPEAMAETFVRALRLIAPLRIAVAVTLVATGAGVAAWRWARASGQRRAVG